MLTRSPTSTYTPDYLVVDQQKICAYEIKADFELERLMRERPADWIIDQDRHHYLPASKHFKSMGIEHVVVPVSSLNPLRADNLRLLTSAREAFDTKRYRKTRQGIQHLLKHELTMRVSDVLERIGDCDETPILQLLDAELIFADLDRVTLSDPSSVWISTSLELAKIAQESSNSLANLLSSSEIDTNDILDPRYELEVATRLTKAKK